MFPTYVSKLTIPAGLRYEFQIQGQFGMRRPLWVIQISYFGTVYERLSPESRI